MYEIRKPAGINEFVPVMQELVKLFQPHTYVELGIRKAYTFNRITSLGIVQRAVAVDPGMKGVIRRPEVETYLELVQDFAKHWRDPIEMLFHDASHDAQDILEDFDALSPYVVDRGLILIHDTYPVSRERLRDCHTAWIAAREIHLSYPEWEIVTLPGTWAGLSIIRRAKEHLHWMNIEEEKRERSKALGRDLR